MRPRSGAIWLIDFGLAAKTPPVVIVSRLDPDPQRALVVYIPLTTQNRNSLYEVEIPRLGFLHAISVANVQGIVSIPAIRLERKLGTLPDAPMAEIRLALLFALDLHSPAKLPIERRASLTDAATATNSAYIAKCTLAYARNCRSKFAK